jgi:hypothetical protein
MYVCDLFITGKVVKSLASCYDTLHHVILLYLGDKIKRNNIRHYPVIDFIPCVVIEPMQLELKNRIISCVKIRNTPIAFFRDNLDIQY